MRAAVLLFFAVLRSARADEPLPAPPKLSDPPPAELPGLRPPVVLVGRVESDAIRVALADHTPHMQACASAPTPALPGGAWPTGQVTFSVKVRRGKATFSLASTTTPGLEWITPCLERELVHVTWPTRRGDFTVPLEVAPGP